MTKTPTDFFKIFAVLHQHNVDYIIIGGVSAVLHGAPVTTFDLDLVHNRAPDNLVRLLRALQELNASYRTRRDIRLEPDLTALAGPGHHLLLTNAGPLDLLGTVSTGQDYLDLFSTSELLDVDDIPVRIQSLESLIQLKQQINREKDRAVLPLLQQTLQEKQKKQ